MNDWYHIIYIITHFNGEFSNSFLTGIYEILSWLRDKDYSPTFKIPVLFFGLYVLFYIPTFILIN